MGVTQDVRVAKCSSMYMVGPEEVDDGTQASMINIFSTYNETVPLWDFHLKDRDCTHFCNPSGYELWTYLLKEKLIHLQPWLAP